MKKSHAGRHETFRDTFSIYQDAILCVRKDHAGGALEGVKACDLAYSHS